MLTIAERADTDWFQIEEHLAREGLVDAGPDGAAPEAAGGII